MKRNLGNKILFFKFKFKESIKEIFKIILKDNENLI